MCPLHDVWLPRTTRTYYYMESVFFEKRFFFCGCWDGKGGLHPRLGPWEGLEAMFITRRGTCRYNVTRPTDRKQGNKKIKKHIWWWFLQMLALKREPGEGLSVADQCGGKRIEKRKKNNSESTEYEVVFPLPSFVSGFAGAPWYWGDWRKQTSLEGSGGGDS